MWTYRSSVRLSGICTWVFLALLAAGLVAAPRVAEAYTLLNHKPRELAPVLAAAYYSCAAPAAVLLWKLRSLLSAIGDGHVFTEGNVMALRHISWCCFLVAVICLGFGFAYLPFFFVAVAAAFMGLILRVIKNVFEQALILKEENDYTI